MILWLTKDSIRKMKLIPRELFIQLPEKIWHNISVCSLSKLSIMISYSDSFEGNISRIYDIRLTSSSVCGKPIDKSSWE